MSKDVRPFMQRKADPHNLFRDEVLELVSVIYKAACTKSEMKQRICMFESGRRGKRRSISSRQMQQVSYKWRVGGIVCRNEALWKITVFLEVFKRFYLELDGIAVGSHM